MMKQLVCFVVMLLPPAAMAQEMPAPKSGPSFTTHIGLLGAYSTETGAPGGGVVVEPKLKLSQGFSIGLRTAVALTGSGDIGEEASVGMGVNVSAMGKLEYSLPWGPVRPMVGVGVGFFYLLSQDIDTGNASVRQQAGEYFGLAPQFGVDFGRGRLALTYNAVLGANVEVIQSVGETEEISQNYWSLELGFHF